MEGQDMTDYTELVKALLCENTGDDECGSSDCPYWSGLGCMDGQLMEDAAAAIEDLQAEEKSRNENCEKCADATRRVIIDLQGIIADLRAQLQKRGEIVRCGECKWYGIYYAKKDGSPDKRYRPSVCLRGKYAKRRDPDWFCADGEREVQG